MRKAVVIFTGLLLLLAYVAEASTPGPNLAVVDFSDLTGLNVSTSNIGLVANELLGTLLTKAGFDVVERDKLYSVLKEQRLSVTTQLVDPTSHAIEAGRLSGADFVVTGSVMNLTVLDRGHEGQEASISVSVRLLDVTTGRVLLADTYDASMPVRLLVANPVFLNAGEVRMLLRTALESAAVDVAQHLSKALESKRLPQSASLALRGRPLRVSVVEDGNKLVLEYGGQRASIPIPFELEETGQTGVVDYGAILDEELGYYTHNGIRYSALEEMLRHCTDPVPPTRELLESDKAEALQLWSPTWNGPVPFVAEDGSYYGEISPLTHKPKTVFVRGYFRADGTYVRSHYRSK